MRKNIREIDWDRIRAELADTIKAAREENITLITYNSDIGEAWRVTPAGIIEPYEIGSSRTDWERVKALTEEEIEAMAAADDSLPADWLDHAEIVDHPDGKVPNGPRGK